LLSCGKHRAYVAWVPFAVFGRPPPFTLTDIAHLGPPFEPAFEGTVSLSAVSQRNWTPTVRGTATTPSALTTKIRALARHAEQDAGRPTDV
jgi:hypothetical protein